MTYVDGFVMAVETEKLADYKKIARKAGNVWKEHGALQYVESVGDDVPVGKTTSFTPTRSPSSPGKRELTSSRKRRLISKMISNCRGNRTSNHSTGHFSKASGSKVWLV